MPMTVDLRSPSQRQWQGRAGIAPGNTEENAGVQWPIDPSVYMIAYLFLFMSSVLE